MRGRFDRIRLRLYEDLSGCKPPSVNATFIIRHYVFMPAVIIIGCVIVCVCVCVCVCVYQVGRTLGK